MSLLFPVLLLLVTAPAVVALMRANELFFLRLRDGKLKRVRGRIPKMLLHELEDVVRRGPPRATIRGVSEDGRARLYVEGDLSDAQKQQLKNIVGMWPVAKIRNR